MPILPDLIQPGLKVLFCGTAPGRTSARQLAYYANRRNVFWSTLFKVGLTPEPVSSRSYQNLLLFGIGLTDLCKNEFGNDEELSKTAYDSDRLRSLIVTYRPAIVAFTSKNAGKAFFRKKLEYGRQSDRVGETQVFVLTSPSPRAAWRFDIQYWEELSQAARSLLGTNGDIHADGFRDRSNLQSP